MPLDLDAVKARLAGLDGRMPYTEWQARVARSQADVPALMARVEELEAAVDVALNVVDPLREPELVALLRTVRPVASWEQEARDG